MLFNIMCYIVYDIVYDIACIVIIPNGLQISRSVFFMTRNAAMFKLPLQSFFFNCAAQFVLQHVPLGHVPKDP